MTSTQLKEDSDFARDGRARAHSLRATERGQLTQADGLLSCKDSLFGREGSE